MFNLADSSIHECCADANKTLEQYDAYIMALAWVKAPRNVIRPEMLRDEIEELVQRVRIKLWIALEKKHIRNIKSYIRCIVFSEVVDIVRRCRSVLPLPLNEDGELYQGTVMFKQGEGMQDPAYEVEMEEAVADTLEEALTGVLKLPPRQQYAMICSLNEQVADAHSLVTMLGNYLANPEDNSWPVEKEELQSLRSSLSVARRKLRPLWDKHTRN